MAQEVDAGTCLLPQHRGDDCKSVRYPEKEWLPDCNSRTVGGSVVVDTETNRQSCDLSITPLCKLISEVVAPIVAEVIQPATESHGTLMTRALFDLWINSSRGFTVLTTQTRYTGSCYPATRRNAFGALWSGLANPQPSTSTRRSDGRHSTSVSTSSMPMFA